MRTLIAAFLITAGLTLGTDVSGAEDRHEGYYYPEVTSTELYRARIHKLRDSDRSRRLGFVTGMAAGAQEKAYPPQMAFFAKGNDAEKAILIALDDGRMDTLYRARAVLALLTATARATPVFRDLDPDGNYTFLDLLALLGFEQLTISDGRTYAHQFEIR
ncbi:MAG: molybdopterin-guanine dinucleotide biosynthesis protein A [Thalassobaculaceae bacterium]|nr:molybdopterin-guanine dinucleotide biosynthesis protein A [Thalassobaculaceae bacterium]